MPHLNQDTIEGLAGKLHVYDVEQHGWEHEGLSLEVNARHVLIHLVKDISNKDFNDEELVKAAIAPDLTQYALRLCRWSDSSADSLLEANDDDFVANPSTSFTAYYEKDKAGTLNAIGILADVLHDVDHENMKSKAREEMPLAALFAAKFLLVAAEFQATTIGFDLPDSFDNRLTHLRQRFGIPEPGA